MRTHPFEDFRLRKGLTQSEMAEKIGTTQARVANFENGQLQRFTPEQAKAALEVSLGEISINDCLYDTPWRREQLTGGRR